MCHYNYYYTAVTMSVSPLYGTKNKHFHKSLASNNENEGETFISRNPVPKTCEDD